MKVVKDDKLLNNKYVKNAIRIDPNAGTFQTGFDLSKLSAISKEGDEIYVVSTKSAKRRKMKSNVGRSNKGLAGNFMF